MKEEEARAYIDPVKSAEEKEKGNEQFQKGEKSWLFLHEKSVIFTNCISML